MCKKRRPDGKEGRHEIGHRVERFAKPALQFWNNFWGLGTG